MTWLALAWKWFLGTTVGRWVVGIGAVLAAAAVLAYTMFLKGKHTQADADAAKDAKAEVEAAKVSQQVQTDASQAVAQVQAEAAKQPAPDTKSREDLDNAF